MGILTYTYDIIQSAGQGEEKLKIIDSKENETSKPFDKAGRLKTVENSGGTEQGDGINNSGPLLSIIFLYV